MGCRIRAGSRQCWWGLGTPGQMYTGTWGAPKTCPHTPRGIKGVNSGKLCAVSASKAAPSHCQPVPEPVPWLGSPDSCESKPHRRGTRHPPGCLGSAPRLHPAQLSLRMPACLLQHVPVPMEPPQLPNGTRHPQSWRGRVPAGLLPGNGSGQEPRTRGARRMCAGCPSLAPSLLCPMKTSIGGADSS